MTECEKCGRTDGHWLGCPEATREVTRDAAELCALAGCGEPKRPQDKGPKPKYCTEHSDPKNRK